MEPLLWLSIGIESFIVAAFDYFHLLFLVNTSFTYRI